MFGHSEGMWLCYQTTSHALTAGHQSLLHFTVQGRVMCIIVQGFSIVYCTGHIDSAAV